jgi:hypothetical protein
MEKLIKSCKTFFRRGLFGVVLSLVLSGFTLTFGLLPSVQATTYYCVNPTISVSISPNPTNSTNVSVNYSGFSCKRTTYNSGNYYPYVVLFISHTDSTFPNSTGDGNWGRWYTISTQTDGGGALNSYCSGCGVANSSVSFDMSDGGHDGVGQGSATVYVGIAVDHTNPGTSGYIQHAGYSVTGYVAVLPPAMTNATTVYDSVGPSVPSGLSPGSTAYTNASSYNYTWSASSDGTSGMSGYNVDIWSATPDGAGGCGGFSEVGVGGGPGTSYNDTGNYNTCREYRVQAMDKVGNLSSYSGFSAPVIFDNQSPPTTISTSTPCLVPGQNATFTVGRTDPAPSSGWGTWANASTSWWNGTEDPWSGAWRNDPWLYNTNSSATYSVGVPTPTVGTSATYTRVVWTQDNARNNSDGVYSQGRSVGVNVTVDNSYPSGLSLSGVPATTNSATVNVTTHSTAGGCAGVTNVAISNDYGTWLYGQTANGTISNWNITSGYGGSSAQGIHTIYVAFFEGTSWNYISTTVNYDTTPPVTPAAPLIATTSDTCAPSHCPASGGLTSIADGLVFTGSAEAGSTVNVYVDGGVTPIASPVTATGGSYSITTTTALSAGPHTITIKATDAAGNTSSASSAYTMVVHLTCPN